MPRSGKGRSPGIARTSLDSERVVALGVKERSSPDGPAACLRRAQAGSSPTGSELSVLQDTAGNAAVTRLLQSRHGSLAPTLQAKLMVGAANDPLEREADRVADHVMRTWSASSASVRGRDEDDFELRRRAHPSPDPASAFEADTTVAQRLSSRRGGGHALPPPVRHRMEAGFGADFGGVRIHRDAEAADLSTGLAAQAFTHGRDIYFGRGAYDPASRSGQHLLAHELTHVVQQGG